MASRYFGVNQGQQKTSVVQGSGTNSTNVEFVVDLAAGMSKSEVLQALEYIEGYIVENIWPPA